MVVLKTRVQMPQRDSDNELQAYTKKSRIFHADKYKVRYCLLEIAKPDSVVK